MGRTAQFALVLQFAGVCMGAQPIGILFDFSARPDAETIDTMKSEIQNILAPADLNLAIQPISAAQTQSFRKIVIVRFRGTCEGRTEPAPQFQNASVFDFPALGRTYISAGHVLPYIQVYCDEVREFVPLNAKQSVSRTFGRALGRVVAHELYHALLSTRDHSRTGIARFAQSPRDLTREKLALDARSILRLRTLYAPKEKEDDPEGPSSIQAYRESDKGTDGSQF